MEVDAIFQGNDATMEVQMTESDSTFEASYEERMSLMGTPGKSAYQIAVDNGYKGTEKQWLESLKGDAYTLTNADKNDIADIVLTSLPVYDGEVVAV